MNWPASQFLQTPPFEYSPSLHPETAATENRKNTTKFNILL
jgi:hypothetical protein